MVEESNKELEDWANEFCVDFERYVEEENRRMEEQDIVLGIIFDNEEYDMLLDYYKASFELKKEDLKDYVYVDTLRHCKEGCEDEYINRTYKFIRMDGDRCAIFYRDY